MGFFESRLQLATGMNRLAVAVRLFDRPVFGIQYPP